MQPQRGPATGRAHTQAGCTPAHSNKSSAVQYSTESRVDPNTAEDHKQHILANAPTMARCASLRSSMRYHSMRCRPSGSSSFSWLHSGAEGGGRRRRQGRQSLMRLHLACAHIYLAVGLVTAPRPHCSTRLPALRDLHSPTHPTPPHPAPPHPARPACWLFCSASREDCQ